MALRLALALVAVALLQSSLRAGDVGGKVYFKGTAPRVARIVMSGDPRCVAAHKDPLYAEDVVINPNGSLRNVIISVKSGLPSGKLNTLTEKVTLTQRGCRYTPHVIAMMAGQTLEVVNDDPTLHNVHALSTLNPAFNIAQPKQGMKLDRIVEQAEIFKVKCEVHPWMGAYIGVFTNPYFSVTGDEGEFIIKGLPPGEYVLEAWHERYGTRTISVKVATHGITNTNITYENK